MFYSPLRYPGGKGKLTSFMEYMIDKLGHRGGTYIESCSGNYSSDTIIWRNKDTSADS